MRTVMWLGMVGAMGVTALTACGNGGMTTGAGGSGTSGTAAAGTGGKSATSSTGTSSGTGSTKINGCDAATAEDHTTENPTMVMFGGATGLMYSPPCLKIKKGSGVMFHGDFASHPLSGGLNGTKDAASPVTETKTGMEQTITFPATGTFGFFCEIHVGSGMEGAVFVE